MRGNRMPDFESDKKEADLLNDKGIAEYNQGNYNKAEEYYKQAIAKDPTHKWALYNIGLVYKALSKYDSAIEYYQKALKIDSNYADAFNGIGVVYYALNKYDLSEEYYLKAIKADNKLPFAHYNMALVMEKKNNTPKAKEYYEKAIELDPTYSSAHNGLGIVYYNDGDYDKAMYHYQKALASDPKFVYAYYNIGLIYEKKEEWRQTYIWYKKALKVDPAYKPALDGLDFIKKQAPDMDFNNINENETEINPTAEIQPEKTILEKYGRNLTQLAKENKLSEPVGRDKEIQSLLEILYKRIKNNPILVGNPGVGKTAIVEGLAKRVYEGNVPDYFKDKEIIEFSAATLIAGTTYRGQMEERVKSLIEEVKKRENVIIFFDEIHTIVGAGRTEGGNLDIAQMLKPVLGRGEFPCIGATTYSEYQKYFEKDEALERRFYPIKIDELSPEATVSVLKSLKEKMEKHYHIVITDENIDTVVKYTQNYIKKRYFPDKAIDVFEKSASRVALKGKKQIDVEDIQEIISESTGINFLQGNENESARLLNMEEFLKASIMGQDEVINHASDLIRMTKRRLDLKPERPDGVFLFAGPSGVGKTELAKQICYFLYGTDKKLIKLDMTEFSEPHSISKLIGSPPGYVGYQDQTYLISQIEENPSSVLILDEVEKAHPDIIKLFLQVFDEGKLKDARGKTVFFSDVTIILTSNAIREWKAKKTLGFNSQETHAEPDTHEIVEELAKFFPLEFLNRIDEIFLFKPLKESEIEGIIQKKLIKRAKEIFSRQDIQLEFDASIIAEIIKKGYSREFGARNLERTFESLALRPLSNYLFAHKTKPGLILQISWEDGKLKVVES